MVKLSSRKNKFYFVELDEVVEKRLAAKIEGERTSFSFEELEQKYAVGVGATLKQGSTVEG
jgi:thioredoxin-related protein